MAPLGSLTKPEIEPRSDCANPRLVRSSKTSASAKARNEHTRFILFYLLFGLRTNPWSLCPGTGSAPGSVCGDPGTAPPFRPIYHTPGCTRVQDISNYTGKQRVSRGKKREKGGKSDGGGGVAGPVVGRSTSRRSARIGRRRVAYLGAFV